MIVLLIPCALLGAILLFVLHRVFGKEKINSLDCHHVISAPEECDTHCEVVVVGAGVLGSAIAATLSRDGRQVLVVERDLSEPDRIVGELLQPGGYAALTKLGLQDAVEGIDAHIVHGYVVHDVSSHSTVSLSYPSNKDGEILSGRSFHHGRFVMGLRSQAKKSGAMLIEGRVSSLLQDKCGSIVGVSYKEKKTNTIKVVKADLTIVADGCFSKFRKNFNYSSVAKSSHFAGLIMHNCPQYKPGHAEIFLTSLGPVLVYQISSSDTRILVDLQGEMPSNMSQFLKEEIGPQLSSEVQKAFEAALEEDRIRTMPNNFLPPTLCPKPGVLILGDAFNMRHPLTGAGMSVALNDVLIWRDLLRPISNLLDYSRVLSQQKIFLWKRKGSHSFVVNVLAQALYALFSASDSSLYALRKACFEYFKLGGKAVTGPVGLLSILHPNPFILIGHFFAVAIFAVWHSMKTYNILQFHKGTYHSAKIFIKACKIIFPLIKSEIQ